MRLAYKDRTGGPWREFRQLGQSIGVRIPIARQYAGLEGLGNVVVATVRGNKINRRFARAF